MMRFRRTLRYKLTMWYCIAMTLGLCIIGSLVFVLVRYHMVRHYDDHLRARGASILAVLADDEIGSSLTPRQEEQLRHMGRVIITERFGGRERVIHRSRRLPEGNLDSWIMPPSKEVMTAPEFQIRKEGRIYWRVLLVPFDKRIGEQGVIRVFENMGDVQAMLRRLMLDFTSLALLGVLASFAGAYWIVGRALTPIIRIIEKAREIEASSLDQRIPDRGLEGETGMLAETLNRMFARLETSFDAMKRFTADASHELRNPLATVRNTIDVTLEQERTSEEYEAAMKSMGEEVDRIRTIVEDLLFLARADANRVVMKLAPVGLDHILEAQIEAHQFQAQERNIHLEVLGLVPDEILGDDRWLHQVVGNLLDNALKYTPIGGTVSADLSRQNGMVRFSVLDTGPGIPEPDLTRIFERFFRSDLSRSRTNVPGVGLGLAIAAWVVKEHGGSIAAANRPGGGAIITADFPKIETA
ncbi:MAG: HAMP domain-containing protein [Holophagaceae bacterium]|nr:HAMP domain-containing protein [Holophagaceae bacterium]